MAFCLTKQASEDFRKALRDGVIDPVTMSGMESLARREMLSKYVGKENAVQVNALFESKLLLKNQKAGYISWAKKIGGMTTPAKRDLISKIERMDKVLNPEEEQLFLKDLAETGLGVEVTQVEAKTISDLSQTLTEAKSKMKKDFTWESKQDGINYGAARVAIEKYIGNLKSNAGRARFVNPFSKENGFVSASANNASILVKGIADNSRAFVASFDNSLWGNQGLQVAFNPKYTKTWAKNFAKSLIDITRILAKGKKEGDAIMDAVKTEIYARKNSLNGRYETSSPDTSKLAINVVEEEIPTSLPSRIPVLGRLFKASEVAYEAGVLRLRTDIADKIYAMAERAGQNLNDKEIVGSKNVMVNSMTGRGRIGKSDKTGGFTNAAMFSVRFFKSNLDFITFGQLDKVDMATRKERAVNVLWVLAATATLLGISKATDDDSVEFDPRSADFGKIRKGSVRISVAPYASIITLISRILSNSSKSSTTGKVTQLGEGFGVPDGMDVFWNFTENKSSPIFSSIRDLVRRKDFDGNKPTVFSTIRNLVTPMNADSIAKIAADKASGTLLDVIGTGLGFIGFNTSVYQTSNERTKLIPLNRNISNQNLIDLAYTYSQALGADPETTINRMFTGQRIRKVSGGAVIVERMPLNESQAIKKQNNADNPEMKLDHTVPLQIGGSNDKGNLKLVTSTRWRSYTQAENALGRALKKGKVSKKEAQRLITDMKNTNDPSDYKSKRAYILKKYK